MKCPVPIYIHVIINNTINMLNKSNFTLKEHLIALVAMKCSALRQLCTPLNCLLDRPLYVHCRDLGLVKPLPKATGILSSLLWNVASPLFMFSSSSQYPLAQALYFFSEYFILLCCFFLQRQANHGQQILCSHKLQFLLDTKNGIKNIVANSVKQWSSKCLHTYRGFLC